MIQTQKEISLLIVIPFTYPKLEPEIYCLTEFCNPILCDGKYLLFDIIKLIIYLEKNYLRNKSIYFIFNLDKYIKMKKPWKGKVYNIDFIINKLPGFFFSFN